MPAHTLSQTPIYITEAPTTKSRKTTTGTGKIPTKDRKVIKMFQAITALFLASFLPPLIVLTGINESWFFMYTYFINQFGNSVVYYFVDEEYREEVLRIKTKLKCW